MEVEKFRMYFRAVLALVLVGGGGYMLRTAMFDDAGVLTEAGLVIVGFITGTALTLVINWYYGSSEAQNGGETE